eukprot:augustus_masked-scaffold_5-processed-gene-19.61-mRNA-1 protein AED:0.19 eAED:0.19 QI:0/0/0/0.75/1/1/4/0/587
MQAHFLATKMDLLPSKDFVCRTLDVGGAGPVTGLLEARRMILSENCKAVAVVAGDSVSSMSTKDFLEKADAGVSSAEVKDSPRDKPPNLESPKIVNGYSRYTEYQMKKYGTTREQMAKVSVLMSRQAVKHPLALTKQPHTLEDVLNSPKVASEINLLECARRADGAAAVVVCSSRFLNRKGLLDKGNGGKGDVSIVGGGEAAGPLYPKPLEEIDERSFSCENAAKLAFAESNLGTEDIDWFGLYDCFPICFIRALEAVGLAQKGMGGEWVEEMLETKGKVPVNTHGGLMSFGAPWETPAIYNVIEAVSQINHTAGSRQIENVKRALVYGNGGIFSATEAFVAPRAIPSVAACIKSPRKNMREKKFALGITAVLVQSFYATNTALDFDIVAIIHPGVQTTREPLKKLGFKLFEFERPVRTEEIENNYLREKIDESGCCGILELLKFRAFQLTDYERVLLLDMDALILKNLDELFFLPDEYALGYTNDYAMDGSGSSAPPVQGGFLLIKPDEQIYQDLAALVREGDFRPGTGWKGSKIGWCWGGQTVQGLLAYYFNKVAPSRGYLLSDCIYNAMETVKNKCDKEFEYIF